MKKEQEIKELDMSTVSCPICQIPMKRTDDDSVICEKCGYTSPILRVVHRKK